jgi:GrpB-like predicted nucleotidyltransferase (UPF0157 family)
VVRAADVQAASDVLTALGFTPLGELGVPLRWAFKEPAHFGRTNTYVIVEGCLSLRNHLGVRDALRADKDLRDEYGAVKKRVGLQAANIDDYGRAKNYVVLKILKAAGLTESDVASMAANQIPTHDELPS